ncbi:hypothetical protein [Candidatus Leptofilum sp.]|uniref:hypothetical protein n=1 Tax=Candidatus Leptofilum sp. TaxID=3241576 RepID=UPI003B5BF932
MNTVNNVFEDFIIVHSDQVTIHLDAQNNRLIFRSGPDEDRVRIDANGGNIWLGGNGQDGDIFLFPNAGDNQTTNQATIHLDAENSRLSLRSGPGEDRVRIDANGGNMRLGGNGQDGDIYLFPNTGDNQTSNQATIHLDAENSRLSLRSGPGEDRVRIDANGGNMRLGGNGQDGDIYLFPNAGDNQTSNQATIHLDAENSRLSLRSGPGEDRVRIDANGGNILLGGNGQDGDIFLFPNTGDNESFDQATIHLDGDSGDIRLRNADCAEDFDINEDIGEVEPGTVMVLEESSKLSVSSKPYDKKAAGIISGAGDYKPGIILDRQPSENKRLPVALMGKVYCKVDATFGSIQVGDMLTTSPTVGHAMKADDPFRAFGAVIGKALSSLEKGQGLIPILVSLQ